MQKPQYLVGIDLGTTHTVVAYAKVTNKSAPIKLFTIEQLIAPGEVAARPLLPSVRYHPAAGEISAADSSFSPSGSTAIIGEAARLLGAKSLGRLVTSAKSWLSHPTADATAAILPWSSDAAIKKVSPLQASASYLAHVRGVWNQKFTDAPLETQDIVITVPASFDEGARSLTLEAAGIAGIKHCRLLEEPQAVCYDWLRRHQQTLAEQLKDVNLLLICDVGGGTTDLTLIKVKQQHGPELTRIGVGDHLMLGGDNLDLTLAHLAEKRITRGENKLSAADLSQLIEQCRTAKETLLQEHAPESCKVTLLGGGTRVIGGTRATELGREEVRAIALDGFFPLSKLHEFPDKKRSGMVEFGLPYAAEPAISKHIAAFLKQHRNISREACGNMQGIPDAILLNGGVFRSKTITTRVLDLLASWQQEPSARIKHLDNTHPELAVAYGAVGYAIARRNKQLKIGGGAARSYFLLLDSKQGEQQQGICILPRGSEEGAETILQSQQFALRLGQPVRFNLASLTGDSEFKVGDLSIIDSQRFNMLPPLAVALEQRSEGISECKVQLAVTLTEVGTLKLQCIAINDPGQRWDVEFQIRRSTANTAYLASELPANFAQAAEKIRLIFGNKSKQIDPKKVKNLRAELEKILGPRQHWQTLLLRELFAVLLACSKNRRRSENHERIWLSLTGFCLRPGFGFPLDDWRVQQLWKIYPQAVQYVNATQHWTEWWTLWRRVAGGLDQHAQQKILSDLKKYLNPASARQGTIATQSKQRSYDDMVRLVAVLERLPVDNKIQLGEWLLKRLQKSSESPQTWWAVGRIGARMPFHGSDHHVLAANVVSVWLQQLLARDWKKTPQAGFAATLISRMSGDRARDIDDSIRQRVVEKLKQSKSPASWLQMITEVKILDEKEEKQIFGEALPPGLKLV